MAVLKVGTSHARPVRRRQAVDVPVQMSSWQLEAVRADAATSAPSPRRRRLARVYSRPATGKVAAGNWNSRPAGGRWSALHVGQARTAHVLLHHRRQAGTQHQAARQGERLFATGVPVAWRLCGTCARSASAANSIAGAKAIAARAEAGRRAWSVQHIQQLQQVGRVQAPRLPVGQLARLEGDGMERARVVGLL